MRLIDADALGVGRCSMEVLPAAYCAGWNGLINLIESAPTIDPESLRPKGAWIMRGGKLYCSHCGERAGVTRDMDDFWYTKGTDFCPSCGADMRGDDDE